MLRRRPCIQLLGAFGRSFDDDADFSHEDFNSWFRKIFGKCITDRIGLVLYQPSELVELMFSPCQWASDARPEGCLKCLPDLRTKSSVSII